MGAVHFSREVPNDLVLLVLQVPVVEFWLMAIGNYDWPIHAHVHWSSRMNAEAILHRDSRVGNSRTRYR